MRLQLILLVGLLSLGGLVQCGGAGGDNAKVEFAISPKTPVVINADLTLFPGTDNELVVKAPWFKYGIHVVNKSTKSVTVQSLIFRVTALTLNGVVTEEIRLDPGNFDQTIIDEFAPGDDRTVAANFYTGGLPGNVPSFSYSIDVEVQGWFGTEDAPEKRLDKSYSFTTR